VDIDEDVNRLLALAGQYRFDEAAELASTIYTRMSLADKELKVIEEALESIGTDLNVFLAPAESDLRKTYDEVLGRIESMRNMPDLYEDILTDLLSQEAVAELLRPTELALKVQPVVAFVGDSICVEGILTSEGEPLARRYVDILLNGSRYFSTRTGTDGRCQDTFKLPYWYIPDMELQALYYPRKDDIGLYIASLSPVVTLNISFYEAALEVRVEDKAYPGLETIITGRFDYGLSPLPEERKTEIYLDDVIVTEAGTREEFSQIIELSPDLDVGKHTITVSAAADDRYSPVTTSSIINITKANPIIDINMPTMAMIPGRIDVGGKISSEIGPLSGASVRMERGNSHAEAVSSEDGTFNTEIKMGMEFSLIGSQDLGIEVIPREPWHASLTTTRNIIVINVVNCSAILVVLVVLGVFLPGRLRVGIRTYFWRKIESGALAAQTEPAPVYSKDLITTDFPDERSEADGEPRDRIFYWYRLVVRLAQRITEAILKPQQTLREFVRETSRLLGPAAKYFVELTRTVERLLYSQYRATEKDVDKSKQLSHDIEKELRGEGI